MVKINNFWDYFISKFEIRQFGGSRKNLVLMSLLFF